MTMAPNQKKRGFLLEIIFICLLLFLLVGSRTQSGGPTAKKMEASPKIDLDMTHALQGALTQPLAMR